MTVLDTLTPADRDAAIAGFTDDLLLVATHILRNPVDYPLTHASVVALVDSLMRRECPDVQVLNKLLQIVCFYSRYYPTNTDSRVYDAAWRLSDALHFSLGHGPRPESLKGTK